MKSLTASEFPSALSAQLARVSPRERRLLAILALAAMVAAPVGAFDLYQSAQSRNIAARADLDKALQAARSLRAGGVGGQMARERQEIRSWSWQAPSAPIGRVLAQDRIAAIATHAGLTDAEIKGADKIERVGEVDLVKIDVNSAFSWAGFSGLLAGLGETGKGFFVDSLIIEDAVKPRLKMSLKLPIAPEPEPPA